VHRSGKLGLGTALLTGMRYAMQHDYDHVVTMDADLSHEPRYLPALIAGMLKNDVMIGSRYVPGGGTIGWPGGRQPISAGGHIPVRVLMRLSPRDCSGGFRCYRVSKLRQAGLDHLLSHGYSFQEEVLYRCRQVGCRIGETPIVFENRRAGASKADVREMIRSLSVLLQLGIPAFFGLDRWVSVRRQQPAKPVDQHHDHKKQ